MPLAASERPPSPRRCYHRQSRSPETFYPGLSGNSNMWRRRSFFLFLIRKKAARGHPASPRPPVGGTIRIRRSQFTDDRFVEESASVVNVDPIRAEV
jgi:hypothetical protein